MNSERNPENWEVPAWMEKIVSLMEAFEAPPPWDHESWVGRLSRPQWVRRMEEEYLGSWENFPETKKEATPRKLGLKLGKQLGGSILGLTLFEENPTIVTAMLQKHLLLLEPGFGTISPEEERELIAALKESGPEQIDGLHELIARIFRIVFRQQFAEIAEFLAGFSAGFSTWVGVDLEENSENDRVMAARILFDRWDLADRLTNRREVADFVLKNFPAHRREFFEKDEGAMKAFRENIGKMCGVIGLTDAPRGRKRNAPDSE
jgi:hypothetical protein